MRGLLAAAVLYCAVSFAQTEAPSDRDASDARMALESFLANVDSLTATFTQETWNADQELIETETAVGRFALARPGRFVWHYETPFEQLYVADGESLWSYDVELMQATRIALDDVSAGNPAMLLSGDRDVGEDFDFEPSYQLGDIDFIALIPKDPQADFSRILVGFRDGIPARLEIVDGLNQTTRIDFADPEVNKQLDMTQFEFDPPPKTSVLGGRR